MGKTKLEPRKMFCSQCSYEWTPRVENPKKCPRCQRWLPTPTYEMRFVPFDANGKLKKNCPYVGERGYEDGQIISQPLEIRHEAWWELVDKKSVPKAELKLDQKKRDLFMEAAEISAALRAEQLEREERARRR